MGFGSCRCHAMNGCQRWTGQLNLFRPAGEPFDSRRYEVAAITSAQAKEFVTSHHYSRSYPPCRYRFGLFTGEQLVGAAIYSVPMAAQVLTNVFPGDFRESVELGRFVLLDSVPGNGETWFQARCRALLKAEQIRGIIAFSDDLPRSRPDGHIIFPGHIGTIYQGSNAAYLGRGSAGTLYVLPDATTFSRRAISKIRNGESGADYASQILIRFGADEPGRDRREWLEHWLPQLTTKVRHPGCHKYAWALRGKRPESKPYPRGH